MKNNDENTEDSDIKEYGVMQANELLTYDSPLPTEIWMFIFDYIDISSLPQIKLVCRLFNTILSDSNFWKRRCLPFKYPQGTDYIKLARLQKSFIQELNNFDDLKDVFMLIATNNLDGLKEKISSEYDFYALFSRMNFILLCGFYRFLPNNYTNDALQLRKQCLAYLVSLIKDSRNIFVYYEHLEKTSTELLKKLVPVPELMEGLKANASEVVLQIFAWLFNNATNQYVQPEGSTIEVSLALLSFYIPGVIGNADLLQHLGDTLSERFYQRKLPQGGMQNQTILSNLIGFLQSTTQEVLNLTIPSEDKLFISFQVLKIAEKYDDKLTIAYLSIDRSERFSEYQISDYINKNFDALLQDLGMLEAMLKHLPDTYTSVLTLRADQIITQAIQQNRSSLVELALNISNKRQKSVIVENKLIYNRNIPRSAKEISENLSFNETVSNIRKLIWETKDVYETNNIEFSICFNQLEQGFQSRSLLIYNYRALTKALAGHDPMAILQVFDSSEILYINPKTKQSLLHYFIVTLQFDVIYLLLQAGLSINQENIYGETPVTILFKLCESLNYVESAAPSIKLLELLLDYGADFKKYSFFEHLHFDHKLICSGFFLRCLAFLFESKTIPYPERGLKNIIGSTNFRIYQFEKDELLSNNNDIDTSISRSKTSLVENVTFPTPLATLVDPMFKHVDETINTKKRKRSDKIAKLKPHKKRRINELEATESNLFKTIHVETLDYMFSFFDDRSLYAISMTDSFCNHLSRGHFERRMQDQFAKPSIYRFYKANFFLTRSILEIVVERVIDLVWKSKILYDDDDATLIANIGGNEEEIIISSAHDYNYQPLIKILNSYDPMIVLKKIIKEIDPLKINTSTQQGLLHFFIGTMRLDVIQCLLDAGLSLLQFNAFNETPIHVLFSVIVANEFGLADGPSLELLSLLVNNETSSVFTDAIENSRYPAKCSFAFLKNLAFLSDVIEEPEFGWEECIGSTNYKCFIQIKDEMKATDKFEKQLGVSS